MALQTPVDREFQVLPRGYIRDNVILANFREGLRQLLSPETGLPFTEEEIQFATQPGTRWYIEAQAIDDFGQSDQRRALFLADQLRIERASTEWLIGFHGELWGEELLDPSGGAGTVTVKGVAGTLVKGSTTPNDVLAYKARDPAGNTYQVLLDGVIGGGGTVQATLFALGTGAATNLPTGTVLTWITRDPNMEATALVASDFTGGTNQETNAEFASRMLGGIRHKEGAGNDAQTRSWARKASNSIEDAFIYPCAFNAGSVMIALSQKRGTAVGPLARIPNPATLAAAIAYMTPPASPVYPTPPHVVVVPVNSQPSDLSLRLEMAKGSSAGWADARPFPSYDATAPAISTVTSGTLFEITCPGDATLPGQAALATLSGANAPQLLVWDEATSRFVRLSVTSVQDLGANVYRVTILPVVGFTLAVGQVVSPAMEKHASVAVAVEEYFDSLGPRELFDLNSDPRGARCVRFPYTNEEKPYRAGALVATHVIEALGGASADATLASISLTEPSFPTNLLAGPNMLTLGKLGIYTL